MNDKNRNKVGFILIMSCLLICIISVSYAVWNQVFVGKKTNTIDTATLILTLDETDGNAISLTNSIPVSDQKGLTNKPYVFKVKNSGTISANYRLSLINDNDFYKLDNCAGSKLDWSNIKYSFQKNNEVATKGILKDTNGILNLGTIEPNQIDTYKLILWINSDATNEIMNQHFHGKIKVEAIQNDQVLKD